MKCANSHRLRAGRWRLAYGCSSSFFAGLARQRWKQGFVDVAWRFSGRRYNRDDWVIVLLQGAKPGLVALGYVLDQRADEPQAETSHYTNVRLISMRDSLEEPFLSRKQLLDVGLRKAAIDTQSSGAILLEAAEVSALQSHLLSSQNKDLRSLCVGDQTE